MKIVTMKSIFYMLLFVLVTNQGFANDGAYFASGNQLIPIQETDISVQKEILKIKKINNQFIEVSVYYEFFNPKEDKEILVGFEALSPEGDVDGAPVHGMHPYMRDFTVQMNGKLLPFEVAYVADSLYSQNGKIKSVDLHTFEGSKSGNYVDFFYVYHFKAHFKKGKNIVQHIYRFDVSGSIDYNYHFDYVLTAANRWANKQIDDFTLIIEMEDFEIFNIHKTFFGNANDWKIEGVGKTQDWEGVEHTLHEKDALRFYMQHGKLVFQKKNFQPKGELFIYSVNNHIQQIAPQDEDFYLPFSVYQQEFIQVVAPVSANNRKILRNLPYARRGYIFKDESLQDFFKSMDWYIPNPNYVANVDALTQAEQKWIIKWK